MKALVSGIEGPRPRGDLGQTEPISRTRAQDTHTPSGHNDVVELSVAGNGGATDTSRLGALRQSVQSGRYSPTSDAIARALVRALTQER